MNDAVGCTDIRNDHSTVVNVEHVTLNRYGYRIAVQHFHVCPIQADRCVGINGLNRDDVVRQNIGQRLDVPLQLARALGKPV